MNLLKNSNETIKMLSEWADSIFLAEQAMISKIPEAFHKKVNKEFEIGPDVFGPTMDAQLLGYTKHKLSLVKNL